jgi:hypothetical protein
MPIAEALLPSLYEALLPSLYLVLEQIRQTLRPCRRAAPVHDANPVKRA